MVPVQIQGSAKQKKTNKNKIEKITNHFISKEKKMGKK